jgi:cytidylate kinase
MKFDPNPNMNDRMVPPFTESLTPPPLHGFRGEPAVGLVTRPHGLTVAISRESGARGGSIARRVTRALGWQCFNQEMLGYLVKDDHARAQLLASLSPEIIAWANQQVEKLTIARSSLQPELLDLIRMVFVVAARGEVVIVGRGAGFLLPVNSTLNVRIVAPPTERLAYLGQWLRMTGPEATAEMATRDRARSELHRMVADRDPTDLTQYDLVLNSGRLGEVATAELIVQAVKAKHFTTSLAENLDDEPV